MGQSGHIIAVTMSSYYQAPSSSYGVPQSPPLDSSNNNNFFNNNPVQSPNNFYLYNGYADDVYLLIKLGEAALIIFIIFAIVSIIYMIVSCCLAAARNK